jgi:hypothetical protein
MTMSNKDDGGPAFPNPDRPHTQPGMSLRDWFAGQALAWLVATGTSIKPDEYASECYMYADAMLAARKADGHA